jgi:hypothetical protein
VAKQQQNESNPNQSPYRHAFMIIEPKRGATGITRHIFCAESDYDRDDWVKCLSKYVDHGRPITAQSVEESIRQHSSPSNPTLRDKLLKIGSKNDDSPDETVAEGRVSISRSVSSVVSYGSLPTLSGDAPEQRTSEPTPQTDMEKSERGVGRSGSVSMKQLRRKTSLKDMHDAHPPTVAESAPPLPPVETPKETPAPPPVEKEVKKDKGNRRTNFFGRMFKGDKDQVNRTQFGVPIEQAISTGRVRMGYECPAVIHRCIEFLEAKNAELEEGIYRLSGSSTVIKSLKDKFDAEGDFNILRSKQDWDVHAVAGLLKLFLRELPTSVLTRHLHTSFILVMEKKERVARVNELGRLVSELPVANYTLLRALVSHLIRVIGKCDVNKMTLRNIGIVFAPTLGIPAGVFNLMVADFEYVFFVTDDGTAAPIMLEEEEEEEEAPPPPPKQDLSRNHLLQDSHGRNNRNSLLYTAYNPDMAIREVGFSRKIIAAASGVLDETPEEAVDNHVTSEGDDVGPTYRSLPKFGSIRKRNRQSTKAPTNQETAE